MNFRRGWISQIIGILVPWARGEKQQGIDITNTDQSYGNTCESVQQVDWTSIDVSGKFKSPKSPVPSVIFDDVHGCQQWPPRGILPMLKSQQLEQCAGNAVMLAGPAFQLTILEDLNRRS